MRPAPVAGNDVLAEKPLATTSSAARGLADLANGRGRRLAVGYQDRFHPAMREMRDLITTGALGSVAYLRASCQTQYAGLPDGWQLQRETSGGWSLIDIGIHTLDAALWLTGSAETRLIGSRLSTQHWDVAVDDLAMLLLQLGNATAVESATGVQGSANRVEVYGSDGWAIATSAGIERDFADATNPYEAQMAAFAAWTAGADFVGATGAEGAVNASILEEAREGPLPPSAAR